MPSLANLSNEELLGLRQRTGLAQLSDEELLAMRPMGVASLSDEKLLDMKIEQQVADITRVEPQPAPPTTNLFPEIGVFDQPVADLAKALAISTQPIINIGREMSESIAQPKSPFDKSAITKEQAEYEKLSKDQRFVALVSRAGLRIPTDIFEFFTQTPSAVLNAPEGTISGLKEQGSGIIQMFKDFFPQVAYLTQQVTRGQAPPENFTGYEEAINRLYESGGLAPAYTALLSKGAVEVGKKIVGGKKPESPVSPKAEKPIQDETPIEPTSRTVELPTMADESLPFAEQATKPTEIPTKPRISIRGELVEPSVNVLESSAPEIAPEVVRKQFNTPTEPVKIIGDRTYVLNNANIARFRKAYAGFRGLPPKEVKSLIATAEEAVVNGYDVNALSIARDVKESKRPPSPAEQEGGFLRVKEIEPQYLKEAADWIRLRDERKIEASNRAYERANLLRQEMDEISEMLRYAGGTEAARVMRGRVGRTQETINTILLEAERLKGQRITTPERQQLEIPFTERATLEQKLADMTAKWEAEKLKNNRKIADRIVNLELRKERKAVNRERILADRDKAKKAFQALGYRVNDVTGLSVEGLYQLGQIAKTYILEGASKLDDVIEAVRRDAPDVTPDDVIQALVTKDPKLQGRLKTDATRRVAQLKRQAQLLIDIEKAERGVFEPKKAGQPQPEAIRELQKQLTQLRKEAYQSSADGKRLERSLQLINELQDHLANHTRPFNPFKKQKGVDTQEIAESKAKISELRKLMRAEDKLIDLNEQLRTGDFKIRTKPQIEELPIELQRIQVDIRHKTRQIHGILEELRKKTVGEKLLEAGNLIRTAQTTGDISGSLRQGVFPTISLIRQGKFNEVTKAHGEALKAFFSEFTADQVDIYIRNHPNHYLRDRAKLELTELGTNLSRREEFFQSRIAEHIKYYKDVVNASNRHMTTLLNLLRVSLFDSFIERYPNATRAELTAWADYINKASGRGNLGDFKLAAGALATVFFAPKFAVSRFQTPLTLLKKNVPRVRNEIAKDMASAVAMGITTLTLAGLAGAEVETDPREPDFGKIRIGDTRIDIWAGFQQPARLILRSGLVGTDAYGLTGENLPSAEKDFRVEELWGRFAGWKLSPLITIGSELTSRQNVFHEPVTIQGTAGRAIAPILLSSAIDAYQKDGLWAGSLTAATEFVGLGANTYKDTEGRVRRNIRKLWRDGKQEEAKEAATNWNILNPDNRIVGMDYINEGDTTRIEVAKPKPKAKKKFIYKRVNP